ncbi:MAG: amidohydrolase [Dethiobacteria bacterium]|jgi:aminobenzoyl-glutamate utilization protein B
MNEAIKEWFDRYPEETIALTYDLWSHPELGLKEYHACKAVAKFMRKQGFEVKEVAAEDYHNPKAEPNTVIATWGSGKPVIGIIGELDALPDLGQEAVPYHAPIPGPGHGCSHNLMGGGSVSAASALKYAMEKEGLKGTVKFVDCPAEEIGCGKVHLARNGVFSDMDICLSYHPDNSEFIFDASEFAAVTTVIFEFTGIATHAAVKPWDGRSALDAAELMNIGVQYLREHITEDCSLHYIYTNGGQAPNIVPKYAALKYFIRAKEENIDDLMRRVFLIAEGAAKMTETSVRWHIHNATHGFIPNKALNRIVYEAAKKIPPLKYTEEDYEFARTMFKNFTGRAPPKDKEQLIATTLREPTGHATYCKGSNDISDVSHIVPVTHVRGGGRVIGLPSHHWTVTASAAVGIGQKAMLFAYKFIAQAGYDCLTNPELLKKVRDEFESLNLPPYRSRMESVY